MNRCLTALGLLAFSLVTAGAVAEAQVESSDFGGLYSSAIKVSQAAPVCPSGYVYKSFVPNKAQKGNGVKSQRLCIKCPSSHPGAQFVSGDPQCLHRTGGYAVPAVGGDKPTKVTRKESRYYEQYLFNASGWTHAQCREKFAATPGNFFHDTIYGGTCWYCPKDTQWNVLPHVEAKDKCTRVISQVKPETTTEPKAPCASGEQYNGSCWACPQGTSHSRSPASGPKACIAADSLAQASVAEHSCYRLFDTLKPTKKIETGAEFAAACLVDVTKGGICAVVGFVVEMVLSLQAPAFAEPVAQPECEKLAQGSLDYFVCNLIMGEVNQYTQLTRCIAQVTVNTAKAAKEGGSVSAKADLGIIETTMCEATGQFIGLGATWSIANKYRTKQGKEVANRQLLKMAKPVEVFLQGMNVATKFGDLFKVGVKACVNASSSGVCPRHRNWVFNGGTHCCSKPAGVFYDKLINGKTVSVPGTCGGKSVKCDVGECVQLGVCPRTHPAPYNLGTHCCASKNDLKGWAPRRVAGGTEEGGTRSGNDYGVCASDSVECPLGSQMIGCIAPLQK